MFSLLPLVLGIQLRVMRIILQVLESGGVLALHLIAAIHPQLLLLLLQLEVRVQVVLSTQVGHVRWVHSICLQLTLLIH